MMIKRIYQKFTKHHRQEEDIEKRSKTKQKIVAKSHKKNKNKIPFQF